MSFILQLSDFKKVIKEYLDIYVKININSEDFYKTKKFFIE